MHGGGHTCLQVLRQYFCAILTPFFILVMLTPAILTTLSFARIEFYFGALDRTTLETETAGGVGATISGCLPNADSSWAR